MRVFEDINYSKSMDLEIFEGLPKKAKEIFFLALDEINIHYSHKLTQFLGSWCDDYDLCKSPIEKILLFAFNVVCVLRSDDIHDFYIEMRPQYEIIFKNHKYYADFLVFAEIFENDVNFVVECDGYDFHQKTKHQVKRDNEREYNIKMSGYDVLRFSGTQIYVDSFKCANDIVDYMITKIESELKTHNCSYTGE